jgi:cell division protein FtsN
MKSAGIETDFLEKHGFVTSIQEAEVKGKTWYRVLAGEYATKEEANAARETLLALPRIGYAQIVTVKDR